MTCLLEFVSRRARWTRQDNGFQTFFTSTGSTAAGRAVSVNDDSVTKLTGVVSGGIQGRHVDITIRWDNSVPLHYSATAGDDGYAHGSTDNGINWDSTLRPLDCSDPAASPPPHPCGFRQSHRGPTMRLARNY